MGLTVSTRGCLLLTVAIPVTGRVCGSTWSPADLFPTGTEEGLFLDFADISTLYTDETFATNISAIGDPVGGVIDKSQGGVPGPELVTNGDFASADGWMVSGGWSIADGKLTNDGTNDWQTTQNIGATEGDLYLVTLTSSGRTTGQCQVAIGNPFAAVRITISANGNYEKYCIAGASTEQLSFYPQSGFDGSIEIISVKKLPGNHLIQSTSTARPIWTRHPKSGVRNLLDYSDDLTNYTSWTHSNTGGSAVLSAFPDGTPATRMTATTQREAVQRSVSLETGVNYTMSIRAVVDPSSDLPISRPLMQIQSAASSYPTIYNADLDGDGYGQLSFTAGATETVLLKIGIGVDTTENGFTDILFGRPQLEKSATATAYQTRVSQYDVTEAGSDDCYGLTFDGVDDYMVTAANLDLSGTSQITVCSSAYGNTNNSAKVLIEQGPSSSSSTGFAVFAPLSAGTELYSLRNRTDTINSTVTTGSTYNLPRTNVITGLSEVGGDTVIRIDGAQDGSISGPASGATASDFLHIGARYDDVSTASLHFTGTIYGVTLTDYILDAEQLAALETWTAARTPEVTLA